jgi:hypothetical protein
MNTDTEQALGKKLLIVLVPTVTVEKLMICQMHMNHSLL